MVELEMKKRKTKDIWKEPTETEMKRDPWARYKWIVAMYEEVFVKHHGKSKRTNSALRK